MCTQSNSFQVVVVLCSGLEESHAVRGYWLPLGR